MTPSNTDNPTPLPVEQEDELGQVLEELWGRALDAKAMHDEEMADEPAEVAEAAYLKYKTNALQIANDAIAAQATAAQERAEYERGFLNGSGLMAEAIKSRATFDDTHNAYCVPKEVLDARLTGKPEETVPSSLIEGGFVDCTRVLYDKNAGSVWICKKPTSVPLGNGVISAGPVGLFSVTLHADEIIKQSVFLGEVDGGSELAPQSKEQGEKHEH